MKLHLSRTLLAAWVAAACAGDASQEGMAEDAAAEMPAITADETAIEQIRADYVEHYNLHHASMVADLYADSAFWLGADGNISMNRAEILASLEESMAGSPTLSLATGEIMVMGDAAVARGLYTVDVTPEGAAAMTLAGSYLTYFTRVEGTWKIGGVLTNYNAEPPEGFAYAEGEGEPPEENGTMGELLGAYTTHFNQGHPSMVAALFTDDAVASFANLPPAQGRAAIEATLTERLAASPQIELHDVETFDLGNGWALDGGWYSMTIPAETETGTVNTAGAYLALVRQADDGSWKIHWAFSNAQPTAM